MTIVSHYLPGFKAGGPIRSVANLVARLGDEFDFRVAARDRDLGDERPYPNVRTNDWQQVGLAEVNYLPPSFATPLRHARFVSDLRPDILYFNSLFDAAWCATPLMLMRLSSQGRTPVVIAPRGQFGAGALQYKSARKKSYLAAFKLLGLMRLVTWHATCESERDDIHRVVGHNAIVRVAPNLTNAGKSITPRGPKTPGRLNLVYYSRVTPKKNLLGAIEHLRNLPGHVTFDVWGPIEDAGYERRCQQQIGDLPNNIDVRWCGALRPEVVADTLAQYDAMLLPTLGENFGHAIVEALAAGCPVVISDRTPWRGLEAEGVGWDLPLDCPHAFQHVLTALCRMDERGHEQMRARSMQFAARVVGTADHVDAHRRLFQSALGVNGVSRGPGSQQAA